MILYMSEAAGKLAVAEARLLQRLAASTFSEKRCEKSSKENAPSRSLAGHISAGSTAPQRPWSTTLPADTDT